MKGGFRYAIRETALVFILEGEPHSGPIADDLAVFDLHVQLADLGNSEVLQTLARNLHRVIGGVLPGLIA